MSDVIEDTVSDSAAARTRSFQQLDPVTVYSTRSLTVLFSVGLVVYTAIESTLGWTAMVHPVFELFAFIAVVLAAAGAVYYSSPKRAPFARWAFASVFALAIVAMSFDAAASTWVGSSTPPGEWGTAVVGVVLVQLSHYRPARDIAVATVFGSIAAGFIVILHPTTALSTMPELVILVQTVIPIVALGFGSAAYAAALARSLDWARSRSTLEARSASDALREHIVRSVRLERVGILNQQVIPFFSEILARDRVTPGDSVRAAEISDTVRGIMIADVDRTWLDALADQLADDTSLAVGSEVVQDPLHLAALMSTEQRIVMRVLLVALVAQPGFDADGFAVQMSRFERRCEVTITSCLDSEDPEQRSGLGAYLAVLRIVFDELHVAFVSSTLTLRFSYEHE